MLGTVNFPSRGSQQDAGRDDAPIGVRAIILPVLIAMSAAAQAGWALFGVLSGSRMGATGAVMLGANLALAVPLLVVSSQRANGNVEGPKSRLGIAIGAASLLGLPPFGGFTGTLMVAQGRHQYRGLLAGGSTRRNTLSRGRLGTRWPERPDRRQRRGDLFEIALGSGSAAHNYTCSRPDRHVRYLQSDCSRPGRLGECAVVLRAVTSKVQMRITDYRLPGT